MSDFKTYVGIDLYLSYVPNKTMRGLRKLGRHYHTLSETLSTIKVQLRWLLNQNNLRGPENLTSHAAQRWLLAHGD